MTSSVAKAEERRSDSTTLGVVLGLAYGCGSIVLGLVCGPLLTMVWGTISFGLLLLCLTIAKGWHMAKAFIWGMVVALGVFLVVVVQIPGWIYRIFVRSKK